MRTESSFFFVPLISMVILLKKVVQWVYHGWHLEYYQRTVLLTFRDFQLHRFSIFGSLSTDKDIVPSGSSRPPAQSTFLFQDSAYVQTETNQFDVLFISFRFSSTLSALFAGCDVIQLEFPSLQKLFVRAPGEGKKKEEDGFEVCAAAISLRLRGANAISFNSATDSFVFVFRRGAWFQILRREKNFCFCA
ncbi:unnamed protein product [Caenorhabditis brenneri]